MQVWVGEGLVDSAAAVVSVLDHGFTVGDGVFETVKAQDGRPFALQPHLDRMTRSTRAMGLPDPDQAQVRAACRAVLGQPAARQGLVRLRITYAGGPGPLGSDRDQAAATLVVVAAPAPTRTPTERLATVPWPRNERGALAGVKSTSYGENVVALAYAKEHGAGEAIFGNTQGMLCEGTGTNIFVVLGGVLRTPPLTSGCLDGITRDLVLRWTDGVVVEGIPLDALQHAEEVFVTSSTRDIHPVSWVDGRAVPAPGPVTERAVRAWDAQSPQAYEELG